MNHTEFVQALLNPTVPTPPTWGTRQGMNATARMNVYRNNVMYSLLQALCETFPVLASHVGQKQFERWATRYIRMHPPKHPVLTFYGEDFPHVLATLTDAPQTHLVDLARLEFARIRAFHARDDVAIDPVVLSSLLADPERLAQLRLPLCDAVTVLRSNGPIFDLWAAHQQQPPTTAQPTRDHGQCVLIAREGWDVVVLHIDEASARFYALLQAGHTLGQALGDVLNTTPEFDPATAIALLLRQGCIRAPNLQPPNPEETPS